ncbi:MAG: hypothetical protein LBV52_05135 [Spirochaetaceae bacterium]|jgi:tetratricopeptide (TPR) repeat protein|nr:hypothetical protein [Spirochaetaceae bacterium]
MQVKNHLRFFFMVIMLAGIQAVFAQDNYKETYLQLLRDGKYDELKTWLAKWEKAEPKNPEMFIGYFNYYANRSKREQPTMGQMPNGMYGLYNAVSYDPSDIKKGISYLDKGLKFTPNRLDMYYGKIDSLFAIKDYESAGKALYHLIGISPKYNETWLLGGNRPAPGGEMYFLQYIGGYFSEFFNIGTDDALEQAKKCSEYEIKIYPNSTRGYNVLAIYYIMRGNIENALKHLQDAEKVDDTDCVILVNIGEAYVRLKNIDKAQEYLNRVMKIGSDIEKRQAQYYLNYIDGMNSTDSTDNVDSTVYER